MADFKFQVNFRIDRPFFLKSNMYIGEISVKWCCVGRSS
jgi:hypothetical protein